MVVAVEDVCDDLRHHDRSGMLYIRLGNIAFQSEAEQTLIKTGVRWPLQIIEHKRNPFAA